MGNCSRILIKEEDVKINRRKSVHSNFTFAPYKTGGQSTTSRLVNNELCKKLVVEMVKK